MMDPGLAGILVVGAVGTIFLLLLIFPQRKLAEEKGLTPLHQERCAGSSKLGFGFRVGATIPTWRISLYDGFMVLVIGKPVMVRYGNIERVKCKDSFLLKKIEIEGNDPKFFVTLYPRSPQKLAEIFRKKGVSVSES